MALCECYDCGKEISTSAKTCLHCGSVGTEVWAGQLTVYESSLEQTRKRQKAWEAGREEREKRWKEERQSEARWNIGCGILSVLFIIFILIWNIPHS